MEDALLAQLQNTPSDYPEDRRGHSDEGEETGSDEESTPMQQIQAPPQREGRQTGPKGVIEDQKHQLRSQIEAEKQKLAAYNARILAKAPMTTTYLQDEKARKAAEKDDSSKKDSDEDDIDESDEELQRIRMNRLAELKQEQRQLNAKRLNHRLFGSVMDVDVDGFTEEVEKESDRMIPVVVHLYDESIPACRIVDNHLQSLAAKFSLAKFIRASALELDFDIVGSPAVLVYRNNELVVNLVGLTTELKDLSEESLEEILRRKRGLSDSDMCDVRQTAGRYDDAF